MKIALDQPVKNIDGVEFNENGKVLFLKDLCKTALLSVYQNEADLSGEEKFKRYQIALKVMASKDLKIEEIALIKTLIGKCYGAALVGPLYEALEGKSE